MTIKVKGRTMLVEGEVALDRSDVVVYLMVPKDCIIDEVLRRIDDKIQELVNHCAHAHFVTGFQIDRICIPDTAPILIDGPGNGGSPP